MRMLKHYDIPIEGKHAVVVGRSPILGKPMAMMLLNENATVTICHSRTKNLQAIIKEADILVGAVGVPKLIKSDWIKPGAVVIDAGYHPQEKCGGYHRVSPYLSATAHMDTHMYTRTRTHVSLHHTYAHPDLSSALRGKPIHRK